MWLFTTLKAEQLAEVYHIEKASFQRPWRHQAFKDELACRDAAQYAVLSPDSRQLIAYVFVRIVVDEMHLLKIAVDPGWRRRGVATWAMQRCFGKARRRGIDKITLEVRATNQAAIALYVKLGFKKVGTRQGYYTDTGEDALLMTKKIES